MTQFRSFSSKMSAYIASASSVLLLCALISCGLFALKSLKEESLKVANSTLDTTVSDIETVMKEVESVVNNAIWVVKEHIDDPYYMFHITEQIVSNNPHIIGSAIAFEPEFYREKGEYFAPYSCIDTLSGGISTFDDIVKLEEMKLKRVIVGKAIYEGRITLKQIEQWSQNA